MGVAQEVVLVGVEQDQVCSQLQRVKLYQLLAMEELVVVLVGLEVVVLVALEVVVLLVVVEVVVLLLVVEVDSKHGSPPSSTRVDAVSKMYSKYKCASDQKSKSSRDNFRKMSQLFLYKIQPNKYLG